MNINDLTKESFAQHLEEFTRGSKLAKVNPKIIEKLFSCELELRAFCKEHGFRVDNGRPYPPGLDPQYFFRDFMRDVFRIYENPDDLTQFKSKAWETKEEWEQYKHTSYTWICEENTKNFLSKAKETQGS